MITRMSLPLIKATGCLCIISSIVKLGMGFDQAWAEVSELENSSFSVSSQFSQRDERDLLDEILKRRADQDAREERLLLQEALLEKAKIELENKIEELETLEKAVREGLRLSASIHETEIEWLRQVFEGMKPRDAAPVFEFMDIEFAAGLLLRMRPETSALILSNIDPERAYAITVSAAGRHAHLPKFSDNN